jgi:hypothetical protein
MSINSTIRAAVTPIVAVCVPDVYTGTEKEYCTFNYNEIPDIHAESKPHVIRYIVQLHWILPRTSNPSAKKKQIKNALHNAGMTYPSVTNASDGADSFHYVFECEATDGEV